MTEGNFPGTEQTKQLVLYLLTDYKKQNNMAVFFPVLF